MTDTLQCDTCPRQFPRGTLSAKRKNHCPACQQQRLRERENVQRDAMDDKAERIWTERGFADQEDRYYGRNVGGEA